jgi:hypothetical protein
MPRRNVSVITPLKGMGGKATSETADGAWSPCRPSVPLASDENMFYHLLLAAYENMF